MVTSVFSDQLAVISRLLHAKKRRPNLYQGETKPTRVYNTLENPFYLFKC